MKKILFLLLFLFTIITNSIFSQVRTAPFYVPNATTAFKTALPKYTVVVQTDNMLSWTLTDGATASNTLTTATKIPYTPLAQRTFGTYTFGLTNGVLGSNTLTGGYATNGIYTAIYGAGFTPLDTTAGFSFTNNSTYEKARSEINGIGIKSGFRRSDSTWNEMVVNKDSMIFKMGNNDWLIQDMNCQTRLKCNVLFEQDISLPNIKTSTGKLYGIVLDGDTIKKQLVPTPDGINGSIQLNYDNALYASPNLSFDTTKMAFTAGYRTGTVGDNSAVFCGIDGYANTASGLNAFSAGNGNTSSGVASTTFGSSNTASGNLSFAMGYNVSAHDFTETAIGHYSTTSTGSAETFLPTNTAFKIGNGTSGSPSDCFKVDFNGNTTITGNAIVEDSVKTNHIEPLTANDTLEIGHNVIKTVGVITLDSTSSSTTGVIYKNSIPFMHNFRHPTGNTARPLGYNVFLGENAGNFTMGSGATSTSHASYNILIGNLTGQSIASGRDNTLIGGRATGVAITEGVNNTSLGSSSLSSNTTGSANVAIGQFALSLMTGNNNTAIGTQSGRLRSGGSLTTTNNSIYVGYNASASANSISNETVIGYDCYGSGSNTVTLGNASVTGWYTSRQTTAATAGTNLIIQSSGAVGGGTNLNGGMITISPGIPTGTGLTSARLRRYARAATTGTADNAAYDNIIVLSENNLSDNVAKGVFEVTLPTDAGAALTYDFSIIATDGDTTQTYKGIAQLVFSNGNNTITEDVSIDISKFKDVPAATTDMTVTITTTHVAGTKVTINITANAGFTPTAMKLYGTITNQSAQTITQL